MDRWRTVIQQTCRKVISGTARFCVFRFSLRCQPSQFARQEQIHTVDELSARFNYFLRLFYLGTTPRCSSMNKFQINVIGVLLMTNLCFGCSLNPAAINEQPMYGNEVIKEAGSRKAALKRTIKLAWHYFYDNNDPATAMKRFNQAWLLDPNSDEVFYVSGF